MDVKADVTKQKEHYIVNFKMFGRYNTIIAKSNLDIPDCVCGAVVTIKYIDGTWSILDWKF